MNNCKICNSPSEKIFEKIILQKYPISYYRCKQCDFIQTDEVTWLEEAYQSAITSLDIGLISRNNHLSKITTNIINKCFPDAKIMLDYAGGYGMFVRLMRDAGFNFYRQDTYCDNIFANHFDISDLDINTFDLVTGFEVLEHFNNPLNEIAAILNYSENAIFSTEITPETIEEIEKWWYIAEETGQHIAFYAPKTMQFIANHFNKNYYCLDNLDNTLHIFTSKNLNKTDIEELNGIKPKPKKSIIKKIFFKKNKDLKNAKENIIRESLLNTDYNYIKNILNK